MNTKATSIAGTTMYRIAYQVLSTGLSGNGDFCLTKEDAESWIAYLNKEYPDINHWIEDSL